MPLLTPSLHLIASWPVSLSFHASSSAGSLDWTKQKRKEQTIRKSKVLILYYIKAGRCKQCPTHQCTTRCWCKLQEAMPRWIFQICLFLKFWMINKMSRCKMCFSLWKVPRDASPSQFYICPIRKQSQFNPANELGCQKILIDNKMDIKEWQVNAEFKHGEVILDVSSD